MQMLLPQAVVLQQIHARGEGEEREHPVAEEREGRVEFDPGVAAKRGDVPGGVPRRIDEGHQGEDGRQARGEVAEEAQPERGADDQVECDRRPGGELEDLERVADGAPLDRLAAQVEPGRLEQEAGADGPVDGQTRLPAVAQQRTARNSA